MPLGDLARRERDETRFGQPLHHVGDAQLLRAPRAVDQHVPMRLKPLEHVHLMQRSGILDDQQIGREHRIARPDRLVVDPAEGHHRRPGPLRPEARHRLRVTALLERRDGQHLRRRDDPLPPAPVNPHLSIKGLLPHCSGRPCCRIAKPRIDADQARPRDGVLIGPPRNLRPQACRPAASPPAFARAGRGLARARPSAFREQSGNRRFRRSAIPNANND